MSTGTTSRISLAFSSLPILWLTTGSWWLALVITTAQASAFFILAGLTA